MIGLGSDTNMNLVCMTIKEWLSYFWGVTVKTYTVCKMCSMRLIGSISFWIRIRPKASVASFSIGAVHASSLKCSPPSFTHSQRWICQLLAIFRQDGFGFIVRFLLKPLTIVRRHKGREGWVLLYQKNFFRSYHKFTNNSWSNFILRYFD